MTTVIAWISYDPKFAAAYMASDSRITWDSSSDKRWDAGRKIFPSKEFPDILGYAGDVVFPALALSQIVEAMDARLMFTEDSTPWERHQSILKSLQDSFAHRHKASDRDFSILHISGFGTGRDRTTHAWSIEYRVNTKTWNDRVLQVPTSTGVIEALGSGASAAKSHLWKWNGVAPFSREIFSSFCDAIKSGDDGLSGGAPQLAGIYPKGPARAFGIYDDGMAFFNGLPLSKPNANPDIEWRDTLFQRIDIVTRSLVSGAQIHTRPKR